MDAGWWAWIILGFALGAVVGALLTIFVSKKVEEKIKDAVGMVSFDVLTRLQPELVKTTKLTLETERDLTVKQLEGRENAIGERITNMNKKIEDVTKLVSEFEKDGQKKFGEVSAELKNTNAVTSSLSEAIGKLNEVLSGSKSRGQLGEYMAEDVLRIAGFKEDVHYVKQKAIDRIRSIPDFTFFLPNHLRLNMDVKFPYDNYQKFCNEKLESEKDKFKIDFFRDVKTKIKEVTTREYINPNQNTVDCVILFVPVESIYTFIWENEPGILELALKHRVVICSPVTLLAVLAIVRQAVDAFSLQQTSNEILSLFGSFKVEWNKFISHLSVLGKRIEATQGAYQDLSTTRKKKLENPLNRIEKLREEKGLPIPDTNGITELVEEPAQEQLLE